MARTACVGIAAAAAAVALSACGRAGDRTRARAVTERFYAAVRQGNGEVACAQLSQDTRSELESQEQKPCPRAIGSLQLQGGRVTRVQVFITGAKADLAGGETAFLDLGTDGWELSAIGCKPRGKPADRPYDCQLQA